MATRETARQPAHVPGSATVRRVERATGRLATLTTTRMDEVLPWFRRMPAEQRSWIGLVAQAGIASFVEWLRQPAKRHEIAGEVFGAAPRELTRAISLHQTVELVRITVDVVESEVEGLAAPGEEAFLRESILRYSREVAFAAAEVYAMTAEARGAWDARLEALVIDALLRGEPDDALASRVAALGWQGTERVSVVVGTPPPADPQDVIDNLHRLARRAGVDVLAGVHGSRLIVLVGGVTSPSGAERDDGGLAASRIVITEFGPGPVVVGPVVPDLHTAGSSAEAALSALRAVRAWPEAPRPVAATDLLPERALAGESSARRALVEDFYSPVREAGGAVLDTLSAYLEQAGSLEGTARLLFVHPNTVRYRLRRVTELCGQDATRPRDAFLLRLALAFGRLASADG